MNKNNKNGENYRIAPMRFNLVLMMIASSMLFAGLVSAYIVHKPDALAKNTWTQFELPVQFFISTLLVLLSSLSMYMALRSAKQDELNQNRLYLGGTLLLGILFCIFQILGWQDLISRGLPFVNARSEDISASYVWVITFVHALHALGGLVLVSVALVKSLRFQIHKKELTLMKVAHTYWHFVGLLWIYLYLFLYFAG
jgi:cytochrome c oxidase subunit 3